MPLTLPQGGGKIHRQSFTIQTQACDIDIPASVRIRDEIGASGNTWQIQMVPGINPGFCQTLCASEQGMMANEQEGQKRLFTSKEGTQEMSSGRAAFVRKIVI